MNGVLEAQVSNIPLTYNDMPMQLTEVKGCKFTPALFLNSRTNYLVIVTHRKPKEIKPDVGFYDIPDKGCLAWISAFKPVAMSAQSVAGHWCYVWEAIEGMPPPNVIPRLFASDNRGKIIGAGRMVNDFFEVKSKNGKGG